jgi:hypothetical protein
MKKNFLLALVLIGLTWYPGIAVSETAGTIDPVLARRYFAELKRISETDSGRLWGIQLYGPTMFVDPNNRSIVANQPDQGGQLTADNGIYVGSLGTDVNIANTATEWSGVLWTMVSWNVLSTADPYDRARLLIHESWHRIQKDIGIPSTVTSNTYLDGLDGRRDVSL